MIELSCEYLSVRYIWLYVIIIHVHVPEWIYFIKLPECQGTPCSKQARYLKFKWQQKDLNPQPRSTINEHSSI